MKNDGSERRSGAENPDLLAFGAGLRTRTPEATVRLPSALALGPNGAVSSQSSLRSWGPQLPVRLSEGQTEGKPWTKVTLLTHVRVKVEILSLSS